VDDVYVVYKKTSDSKFYLVKISSDDSVTAIAELTELYGYTLVRILVDSNNNIYVLREIEATLTYTWFKYNSSGVLQVSKVMTGNEMFGFIYNGYLYTMISNDDEVHKRSLTSLETAEMISLTSGHRFRYLCFDSDGYLYTYDRDYPGEAAFVKWEMGVGVVEFHQQGLSYLSSWADYALLGNNIAHDYFYAGIAGIIATSLDSDMAIWAMDDIPNQQVCGVASNTSYWYVLGENTADNKLIVEKYDSDKNLISTIEVSSDYISGGSLKYYTAITAYPFTVAVYDYPIAPILFPAQPKGTPLRLKCRHFEESMSDMCLNVNHNVDVTREYLQLTYGDTTYPESSNLRYVLPSQQLVKLSNKDLTTEDFNAIINNFITNITSMFLLINENNNIIKQWLDDYEPNEEGHDFTDVVMKPITIDKDMDEEELSKVMDSLFEAIEDNVIILNSNMELLKERF